MVRQLQSISFSAIAEAAGKKPKTIGTLTGLSTTPEAPDLQRQIRDSVGSGGIFSGNGSEFARVASTPDLRMAYDAAILPI